MSRGFSRNAKVSLAALGRASFTEVAFSSATRLPAFYRVMIPWGFTNGIKSQGYRP